VGDARLSVLASILLARRMVAPIRVLRVERQRHADRHFSTPVMTMPLVKNRWVKRNAITGMIIVISVPAWISSGLR